MRRHIAGLNILPKDTWITSFLVKMKLSKSVGWAECKGGWLLGLCGLEGAAPIWLLSPGAQPLKLDFCTGCLPGALRNSDLPFCNPRPGIRTTWIPTCSSGPLCFEAPFHKGSQELVATFNRARPGVVTDCLEAPKHPVQDHWVA